MPILISPLRQVSGVSADVPSVSRREPAFARGHSNGRLLVSCFAIVSLVVASALGAERITPIQEVLRDNDGNFVPDRLGETFTLSGVLSCDPINVGGFGPDSAEYATIVNLQDSTGGIVLFTRNTALFSSGFKRGDSVQARGKLSQHNGMEELMLVEIRRLGSGAPPRPREVLTADLLGERYSGQLVRVAGELVVPPDLLDKKRGLVLRDRSGEIPVIVSDRFFGDAQFADRLLRGGKAEVVGIAGQFCKDPPFNSGYQLVPRDAQDFDFPPIPPYRFIITSLAVSVLLIASVYLWLRRRSAELHARELTLLTENLKRSEEALRLSEERFRKAFEEGPIGIVLGSADFRILKANRALCQMLGYTEQELVGLRFVDITHPEDADQTLQLGGKLFNEETSSYQLEKRYVTKAQRIIWAHLTASLIRGQDGKPLYALGIIEDISRRREAEQILETSERRFRALIEKSSDSISLINPKGIILYDAEPATFRNLGYAGAEVVGHSAFEFIHPEDVEVTKKLFDELAHKPGSTITTHYRIRHKDGSWHWMEGTGTNLLNEPSVQAIVINARDVTERKRAEEKLHQSEELFSKAFLASPVAITIATLTEGRFIDVNDSFLQLMGYSREEVIGRTALELGMWVSPDHRAAFVQGLRDGGSLRNVECAFRTGSGEIREGLGAAELIELKGERCILTLILDITDRKRFEVELAKARDEALESARIKSEFLANISHEVRTPLNGIIGMTVLLQDTSMTPEQKQFLKTVQASADTLLTIINDILDFSKIEAGKLQFETLDFDLRGTVESTIELLAERAQSKQIELISVIYDDVPTLLRGDPGRLRQVISNLVVNGIKFTEKGEVVLRVTRESETNTHVTVCFTVTDTGIGIPPDALPYLFQAFSQADGSTTRKYGGTGLGLAISKQLVEMMGGQIGVESTLGQGSAFWFTAKFERQKQPVAAPPIKGILDAVRVLVLDDNETNRSILLHQTAALGMRPVGATNGTEALKLLRQEATGADPFVLAILDMQMPGTDGLSLSRTIKADPVIAQTRLLLMTSLGPRNDTALLRAAGVGAFLVKPVKQAQLVDCLVSVLTATVPNETRFWQQRRESVPSSTGKSLRPDMHLLHVLVAEDNTINQKVAVGLLEKFGCRAVAVANGCEVLQALELVHYDIIFMDCQLPDLDGYKTTMEIRQREASQGDGAPKRAYIIAMTSYAVNGAREKCLAAGMDDYISKPVQLYALEKALLRAIACLALAEGSDANGTILDPAALALLRQLRRPDKPDPVAELIDLFVQETPKRFREMRNAATQYDAEALAAAAHNLRGCASSIGAVKMAGLCERLEENAGRRALQISSRLLKEIETEFDRVRQALDLEKSKSDQVA